jgi:hypothetical protein
MITSVVGNFYDQKIKLEFLAEWHFVGLGLWSQSRAYLSVMAAMLASKDRGLGDKLSYRQEIPVASTLMRECANRKICATAQVAGASGKC